MQHSVYDELSCPICWVQDETVEFLRTPCGHIACFPCFERLLLSTEPLNNFFRRNMYMEGPTTFDQTMQEIAASCPTRGQCPICRSWIDLFQLASVNNRPISLERITELQLLPINDMVFVPIIQNDPCISFHFTCTETLPSRPFLRFGQALERLVYDRPFDDFFFYPKSNSFHGKIYWRDDIIYSEHSSTWEVIIQFPSDFRCFSGGAIIKHRLDPYTSKDSNENVSISPLVEFLGPRGTCFIKSKRKAAVEVPPTLNRFEVWGNSFMQSEKIGYASYHFDQSSRQVYISYEHDDCCSWPPLDDGSPVPSRVPFINTSYDSESRRFRGEIAWKEMYHTSWIGSDSWNYEMIFDTAFTCILSGTVHSITQGVSIELSEYGQSLVYVNAALKQDIEERLSFIGEHSIDNHRSISLEIVQRLTREGATVRTIASVTNIVNRTSINLLNK